MYIHFKNTENYKMLLGKKCSKFTQFMQNIYIVLIMIDVHKIIYTNVRIYMS